MSYIEEDKMGGMAVNIFISAATGLLEGCRPMTQLPLSHSITTTTLIDSQRVSFMLRHAYNSASPTAWRFYVKEKVHGHARPSRL